MKQIVMQLRREIISKIIWELTAIIMWLKVL